MKAKKIRDLTTSKIEEQIKSSREELFSLRFRLAADQSEEAARIRTVRRTITRLKTVTREREIEQNKASQQLNKRRLRKWAKETTVKFM